MSDLPNAIYVTCRPCIVPAMRLLQLLFLLCAAVSSSAAAGDRVNIPPMKTSIYLGSVTLSTSEFVRDGAAFTATYEARVWPWFFWSETGKITIALPLPDMVRLLTGETVEFTGEAFNHKNKPRKVSGRAQPAGDGTGRIKVRIGVDDTELIFNGSYRLGEQPVGLAMNMAYSNPKSGARADGPTGRGNHEILKSGDQES